VGIGAVIGVSISAETENAGEALARAVRLIASNPAAAERELRAILGARPGELNATLYLARALRAQRRPHNAANALDALIAEHPRFAPAHYERALALSELGEKENAAVALFAALDLDPKLPNGWLVLAENLFERGDRAGAEIAYKRHVAVSADAPHIRDSVKALHDGDAARAEQILRAYLNRMPTDVAALAVMGEALGRLGENEKAVVLLRLCLERVPSFVAARYNHAIILNQLQRSAEAIAEIESLLREKPDDRDYRTLYAGALATAGDIAKAVGVFEGLITDFPDSAKHWSDYGQALRGAGRQAEAVEAFRRSAALDPDSGAAYWGIANLKTVSLGSDDVASLRAALARPDLDDDDRAKFCFALGKALEDQGSFADSFAAYAEGNALRYAALPHDAEADRRYMRSLQAFFTPAQFAQRAGMGAPAPDPIFVVGLPRSGTTLIEQILDCHSAVEGVSELLELGAIARRLDLDASVYKLPPYPGMLARLDNDALRVLGEDYLTRARRHRKTAKPFFVDKMPGNFEHIGLIHLILPNAKIIDARRHPLACCLSNFKQHYARGQVWTYDLKALGRSYSDHAELMAHYDRVLPGRIHRVFHEKMVENPEREVRALLEFCGLPFEPACLNFHENTRQVRTVSSEQVRRPIFSDGVDQWRNFEPWLGPLKEALGPIWNTYPDVPQRDAT